MVLFIDTSILYDEHYKMDICTIIWRVSIIFIIGFLGTKPITLFGKEDFSQHLVLDLGNRDHRYGNICFRVYSITRRFNGVRNRVRNQPLCSSSDRLYRCGLIFMVHVSTTDIQSLSNYSIKTLTKSCELHML